MSGARQDHGAPGPRAGSAPEPGPAGIFPPPNRPFRPAHAGGLGASRDGAMAAVELTLAWRSEAARHEENRVACRLHLGRDALPPGLEGLVEGRPAGHRATATCPPGALVPARDPALCLTLPRAAFAPRQPALRGLAPRMGRFYPRAFIADSGHTAPGDPRPLRVVGTGDPLMVDLNHPLAGRELVVATRILDLWEPGDEPAGPPRSAHELLLGRGPGLQARWRNRPTDFWADAPFSRDAEEADRDFYRAPRLVHHIDDAARAQVCGLYARLVPAGGEVLDLMSSWTSHLEHLDGEAIVTGLGLNAGELAANPRLHRRLVHDLNARPTLPFADRSFDAIVCTVSVEYLVRPFEVIAEAARVLRPGGRLVLTFSNRWFPPKVVKVWTEIHEFERLGLVLEYLLRDGLFTDLNTWSVRGLPRPADDRYAGRLALADPVYAVWGNRRG